jgi:hypothetical protein
MSHPHLVDELHPFIGPQSNSLSLEPTRGTWLRIVHCAYFVPMHSRHYYHCNLYAVQVRAVYLTKDRICTVTSLFNSFSALGCSLDFRSSPQFEGVVPHTSPHVEDVVRLLKSSEI